MANVHSALSCSHALPPKPQDSGFQFIFGGWFNHHSQEMFQLMPKESGLGLGSPGGSSTSGCLFFHKLLCQPAGVLWVIVLLETVGIRELG